MNKFEIAAQEIFGASTDNKTVLDAGCRDCIFASHIPAGWDYSGLDLFQNDAGTVRFVQSVERPIPAQDRAFGVVVALDVVEHVDRMSQVMDELWRVTDRKLVVALPNMAWAPYRMHFLLTGRMGEKYKVLPYGSDDGDRHRWLTTADDCAKYIDEFAAAKRDVASVRTVPTLETGKRRLFASVARTFGASPQLYAPTLVFVIERN